jgi:photosystem II stability/assembly factor-like uncharacterized protein
LSRVLAVTVLSALGLGAAAKPSEPPQRQPIPPVKPEVKWEQIGPGDGDQCISVAIVAGTVFVGTDIGGVYKSADAGQTWQAINQGLKSYAMQTRVVVSTDTFLVGTRGSVYKSTDGGVTWAAKREGIGGPAAYEVTASVGALAVDPNDSRHVLMGQGRAAIPGRMYGKFKGDVYASKDRGEKWAVISNLGAGDVQIDDIQFDPKDSSRVYAAASGGLFVSADGGKTWKKGIEGPARRIVINPGSPNILHVSAGPKGVYRSDDRGETWRAATVGLTVGTRNNYAALAISARDPKRLYLCNEIYGGSAKGVFKSTDGGETWSHCAREDNTSKSWFDPFGKPNDVCIDPGNDDTVYYGCSRCVYKTTDGGRSWQQMVSREVPPGKWTHTGMCIFGHTRVLAVSPKDPNVMYIGTSDHRAVKSVDGGKSWFDTGVKMPNSDDVFDILIDPGNPERVYAANSGVHTGKAGVVRSTDGGATWDQVLEIKHGGGLQEMIKSLCFGPGNPRRLYACGKAGFHVSIDGGDNWTDTTRNGLSEAGEPHKVVLHPVKQGVVFVGCEKGLYVSDDGGTTWRKTECPYDRIRDVDFLPANPDVMFVCVSQPKARGVHRSADGGKTWTRVIEMREGTGWPEALAILPVKPYPIYVASQDFGYHDEHGGTGIWRSVDQGDTWTNCSEGLPVLRFWNVTIEPGPPYRIFLCSDGAGAFVGVAEGLRPPE